MLDWIILNKGEHPVFWEGLVGGGGSFRIHIGYCIENSALS